jgi:RimJ/RimL family protein N-acetyltransferase
VLIASRITIGPLVAEDFGPLFCWINDVAAARLDFAYRPVDVVAHQQWWDSLGKDQTRVVFAIRKPTDPAIIGYVQINGINSVHRSAEIGIRIGEEKHRGQGYGKEALQLAVLRPAPARQRKLRVSAPAMTLLADVHGTPEIATANAHLPAA